MGTSSKELDRKLHKLAVRQHGCFTAAQAIETGYADSVHLYHVKNGSWIRVFRGVYRLADAPETPAARCMAALLWTRDKNGKILGILEAETAIQLQSGSFTLNDPVRILVGKGFRRSSEAPEWIKISIEISGMHKTSKIFGIPCAEFIISGYSANSNIDDIADYYDWIDYQAVLCAEKPGK